MNVGFIGLGAMGASMARNLHKAGLLVGVWNRTAERAAALAAELGCRHAPDPAALASDCDVIVLCVSADADLLEVVGRLAPGCGAGSVVVDCSTVAAQTASRAAAMLAGAGAGFIDAPVSGGVEGAREATLAIMVGGDPAHLARARPALEAIGRTITHFGPLGAGQAAKATNQIMVAGIIQAVAEALAFAKAEALPLPELLETLGRGAGSSWYFVHRGPNMVRESYPPGFRVELHYKDLMICRQMAARHGVQLPIVEMTLLQYRRLLERGCGGEDISALHRLKRELFDRARQDSAADGPDSGR